MQFSPSAPTIHVANDHQADAMWRMLCKASDEFLPVNLHLEGHGLLYQVNRGEDGWMTAIRPPAAVAAV